MKILLIAAIAILCLWHSHASYAQTSPLIMACGTSSTAPWGASASCGGCSSKTWQAPAPQWNVISSSSQFWVPLGSVPSTAAIQVTTNSTIKVGSAATCSQITGTASAGSLLGTAAPPTAAPTITTTALPTAQVGVPYSVSLGASGGTAPYTWSATGLSAGLTVSGSTITGTPSGAGTSSVTLKVTDAAAKSASEVLSLVVSPANASTCPVPSPPVVTPPTGTGQLTLNWGQVTSDTNGNSVTDITGYIVKWGVTSGSHPNSVRVPSPIVTIANLPTGATYFVVVDAVSTSEGVGADSNEISKAL